MGRTAQTTETDQNNVFTPTITALGLAGWSMLAVSAALPIAQIALPAYAQALLVLAAGGLLTTSIYLLAQGMMESLHQQSVMSRNLQGSRAQLARLSHWPRLLQELSDDWYFETDTNHRLVIQQGEGAQRAGLISDKHLGQTLWDIGAINMVDFDWDRIRTTMIQQEVIDRLELHRKTESGVEYWISISAKPRFQQGFLGYYGIASVVTDFKAEQKKLATAAVTDDLTGLPNRSFFLSRLPGAIAQARRSRTHAMAVLVDLKDFVSFNELAGLINADEALRITGERLRKAVREADTVARLEGDKFAVLLEGLSIEPAVCKDDSQRILEKIHSALREPMQINLKGEPAQVDLRIAHTFTQDTDNANSLISRLQHQMAKTKASE